MSSEEWQREQRENRMIAKEQKRYLQATKMILSANSDDDHNCFAAVFQRADSGERRAERVPGLCITSEYNNAKGVRELKI